MTDAVSPEDARKLVASNEVFVIDVREEEGWLDGSDRIPASTNVPASQLDERLDELPQDQRIMVVCPDGKRSGEVAERLRQSERDAVALEGGVQAWTKSGNLTQPSPDPGD